MRHVSPATEPRLGKTKLLGYNCFSLLDHHLPDKTFASPSFCSQQKEERDREIIQVMPAETKPAASDGHSTLKSQVEQLRIEASIHRKKISETAADLMEYCEKNKGSDTLVSGPKDGHSNPFQEKKGCSLL